MVIFNGWGLAIFLTWETWGQSDYQVTRSLCWDTGRAACDRLRISGFDKVGIYFPPVEAPAAGLAVPWEAVPASAIPADLALICLSGAPPTTCEFPRARAGEERSRLTLPL